MLVHNHPGGVLEPSGADLAVAARLHDGGGGFGIVDNAVTEFYVVVECPRPRSTTRLDAIGVAGPPAPGRGRGRAPRGGLRPPRQRGTARPRAAPPYTSRSPLRPGATRARRI